MPRNVVQWDIDFSKAYRKLTYLDKKLSEEGKISVQELGQMGKSYARSIAPYYSGKTFRNIVLHKGNNTEVLIQAKNPVANDGHQRQIKNFNLVRWMHQSPLAAGHITSGDRKFMYKTGVYLRNVGPGRVTTRFNKVVSQINKQ
jgi:hypothetical protein